jgi:hypothetical protein
VQKEAEPTPHVEEAPCTPHKKSLAEILIHGAAGLSPIPEVTLGDCLAPKPVIVRVGAERREDVLALTASEDVNAKLVENGTMLQTSTHQTL